MHDDKGKPGLHTAPIESGGAEAKPPPKVVAHSDDPMIGTVVAGRYRVDARLGEGGMGAVYRVEHTHMRKKLALKVLHREMTSQTEIVARFEREAMAAAHIEHPNVAGATDFGKLEDGTFFLVLEYVEGESLRSQIDKGPIPPDRAVHIALQILAGLRRAHELGIVHRDLKPENVLLVDKDGDPDFCKVLDFGIARVPIGSLVSGGDSGPSLTRAGMVYGTPEYMAPEQALGQAVDGRSDVYACGVILFEMLTGKRPYDNKDKVALLGQHVAGAIPTLKERAPNANFPQEIDDVLQRFLAKSPSDRFADAGEAMDALAGLPIEGSAMVPISRSPSLRRTGTDPERSGDWAARSQSGPVVITTSDVARQQVVAAGSALQAAPTFAPPIESGEPRKKAGLSPLVLAIAGASLLAIIIAVVVVAKKGTSSSTDDLGDPGRHPVATAASDSATAKKPSLTTTEIKSRADAALAKSEAGDAQGIADLESLATLYDSNPDVMIDLAKAYSHAKRHVDAIGAIKKLVTSNPSTVSDPRIDPVIDAALPTNADTVFTLLDGPMGSEGAAILYDIGYGNRGPSSLRKRARDMLAEPEMQKLLPAAVAGLIELQHANGCEQKKAVLDKYRADWDARVLPLLKPYQSYRGCGGFFKNQDCWPCLHKDKYLDGLTKEINARQKSAPAP